MTLSHQDRDWFCEELQRSKTSLYRLALSITGNPEDAAEVAAVRIGGLVIPWEPEA